jgi:GR25 family glycosyltransferase involved in LPS biosynthesis
MAHADDRRYHCMKQFDKAGIEATFIRGFNGKESQLFHKSNWITCQVGACISHYMAVEMVRAMDLGVTVIMEDDIILDVDFKKQISLALSSIPYDWDVAALAYFGAEPHKGTPPVFEAINHHWSKVISGDVWGQAAYMVNGKKGAENILSCITPIRSHIDRMVWECCRDGLMNGYFINKQFIEQGWDFPSQNI